MFQRRRFYRGASVLLSGACLALLPQAAQAEIIFSNFSPAAGSGFDSGVGHFVAGSTSVIGYRAVAASFVPTQSYRVTSIEIAGLHLIGTNSYTFSLYADQGGAPGGPAVASSTASLPAAIGIALFPTTGILHSGTLYWLVADLQGTATLGSWFANSSGQNGHLDTTTPGGPWNNSTIATPAFRIMGSVAPEPGTLGLLALGGLLGGLARRKALREKQEGE